MALWLSSVSLALPSKPSLLLQLLGEACTRITCRPNTTCHMRALHPVRPHHTAMLPRHEQRNRLSARAMPGDGSEPAEPVTA